MKRTKTRLKPAQYDGFNVWESYANARVGKPKFLRDCRIGDKPIVGIDSNSQTQIEIEFQGVQCQIFYCASLDVARRTAFEGDPVVRDVVQQVSVLP